MKMSVRILCIPKYISSVYTLLRFLTEKDFYGKEILKNFEKKSHLNLKKLFSYPCVR